MVSKTKIASSNLVITTFLNNIKKTTENWWHECLVNKEKLEHWLVSLYNNEKDACEHFRDFKRVCEAVKVYLEENKTATDNEITSVVIGLFESLVLQTA